jgi:hypothetical protein
MGYYRSPEWRELVEAWEEWWFETIEFLNSEGEHQPRPGYGMNALKVVAGLHDLTRLDPQLVWDVYHAIDRWHRAVRPESAKFKHRAEFPVKRIESMIWRVQLHQTEILRLGIVTDDPEATEDSEAAAMPDGPAGVGEWRFDGQLFEGMQNRPWLLAAALHGAADKCLHADDAFAAVEHEDNADRDKIPNWQKKANRWFGDRIALRISKTGDHYRLVIFDGSSEEPEGNL